MTTQPVDYHSPGQVINSETPVAWRVANFNQDHMQTLRDIETSGRILEEQAGHSPR